MNTACFSSKIGWLTLSEEDGHLVRLSFGKSDEHEETAFLLMCVKKIEEYLEGKRKSFDIPITFSGTPFCQKVWKRLTEIDYGKTAAYSEIAHDIGHPKAYRAVGMACGKNPIAIVVPCHRVVGKSGSLTGFAGGISVKEKLLEIEGGGCNRREDEN